MKEGQTGSEPVVVIVGYRPKPEKVEDLDQLTREHYPILKKEGLVTDRTPIVMKASDGTVIEVFEWKSADSIAAAHTNEEVKKMWDRYSACCEFVQLAELKESTDMFAGFKPFE